MEEEVRKEAIRRHVVEGESPKAVYSSLNRSKKWFFKWLKRYQTGATAWYVEHSRAPITRPTAISPQEKEVIVATRLRLESERYAQVGVSAIKWELQKLGAQLPSDSTVHRTLKREGLVKKKRLMRQKGWSILTSPTLFAPTTSIKWTSSAHATSKGTAAFTRLMSSIYTVIGCISSHSERRKMIRSPKACSAAGKSWDFPTSSSLITS